MRNKKKFVFILALALFINMFFLTRNLALAEDLGNGDQSQEEIPRERLFVKDGKTYYADGDGKLVRSWYKVDGYWRFFDSDYSMVTNQWKRVILSDGSMAYKYFDEEGRNIPAILNMDGYTFYSPAAPKYTYHKGWKELDGKWYYFNRSMQKSKWLFLENWDGKKAWKYFNKDGESIEKYYYENGGKWLSLKGPWTSYFSGWRRVNGVWNYFSPKLVKNQWKFIRLSDGKRAWKYFDKNGTSIGEWYEEKGNRYYSPSGERFYLTDYKRIDGLNYYFYKSGMMKKGWLKLNGYTYYFDEKTGVGAKGFRDIDSKTYYFKYDSRMLRGWITPGDGKSYYMSMNDGRMIRGLNTIDGKKYILNPYVHLSYLIKSQEYRLGRTNYDTDRYGHAVLKPSHPFWIYRDGYFRRYEGSRLVDKRYVGNRFIVVSLREQKMWFYNYGRPEVETNVITGKDSTPTITGHYSIYYKTTKTHLMNNSFVNYWMPFEGGYGIHDAHWQTQARYDDPTSYHWAGSHGCVNTPIEAMRRIYNNTRVGDDVIVYK